MKYWTDKDIGHVVKLSFLSFYIAITSLVINFLLIIYLFLMA